MFSILNASLDFLLLLLAPLSHDPRDLLFLASFRSLLVLMPKFAFGLSLSQGTLGLTEASIVKARWRGHGARAARGNNRKARAP